MSVDVIIPACNEAERIGDVLSAVYGAAGIGEVIVVANGCGDNTADVAAKSGAVVITMPEADKGTAMREGLDAVATDCVLFCDADLIGLTAAHVTAMVSLPPYTGQLAGVTQSRTVGLTKLLPPITGQRRLPTDFARRLRLKGSGYGAELRIDAAVGRAMLPHRTVVLHGVTNPTRATRSPLRFAKMAGSVALEAAYLFPDLWRYEHSALG